MFKNRWLLGMWAVLLLAFWETVALAQGPAFRLGEILVTGSKAPEASDKTVVTAQDLQDWGSRP